MVGFCLTGAATIAGVLALMLVLAAVGPPAARIPAAPAGSPVASTGVRTISLAVDDSDQPVALPVRLRIPSIGVDTALVRLSVDAAGALVPPQDFGRAGWFPGSPVPGAVGPAVIAGHVDSYRGPAVFFRLRNLAPGDEVLVDRADGTRALFTVTGIDRYPKDAFPTQRVYGPTARPELRLITCGGDFDREARSYRDNVVVTAVLA